MYEEKSATSAETGSSSLSGKTTDSVCISSGWKKADENQMTIFDFFNEAEILREPIPTEPDEKILVPVHRKRKAKRGSKLDALPVETIYYEIPESERVFMQLSKGWAYSVKQ